MVKHLLVWKQVKCRDIHGRPVWLQAPEVIAGHSRGTLASQILSMPKKNPISFEDAINLVVDRQKEVFVTGQIGQEPGQYCWYYDHFVEWISSLGYHIELSGDEFEPRVLSSLVS